MGIGRAEGLDSLRSDDLIGIGMEADAVRRKLHPEGVVSYAVVGRVDCANGDAGAVCAQADASRARGSSGIVLTGLGRLTFDQIVRVVREVRGACADTWICGLSAAELSALASTVEGNLAGVVERLRNSGWDSLDADSPDLPGEAHEWEEWFAVQRALHGAGMRTTAAMRFGADETAQERIGFLERIAGLQNETGGFRAFAPVNAGGGLQGPTAVECLKLVAISRLMLDSVPTIEAGRATASLKVLETMFRFGADDAGEVSLDGPIRPDLREEDLRRVIRDAGFSPVERDLGYRMMFVA